MIQLRRGDVEKAIERDSDAKLVRIVRLSTPTDYIVEGADGVRYIARVEPRLVILGAVS